MAEPRWVERLVVDAVHLDQVREHDGMAEVRAEDALEAVLARQRHKWAYDTATDLTTLASAYGCDLCRHHPYRDGNERVAFLVMVIFLERNGWRFEAEEEEIVTVMFGVAAGRASENGLADWLRAHVRSKGRGAG